MTFEEIKLGCTYYKLTQTNNGLKKDKLLAKTKFPSMKSIIFVDDKKREIKLYKNDLINILTEEEANFEFSKRKNQPPAVKNPRTYKALCYSCQSLIMHDNKSKVCDKCHWEICSYCGACGCKYYKYRKF